MSDVGREPHPVLIEEREWEGIAETIVGPCSTLVSVSSWTGDSRTYRRDDVVATIRRKDVFPAGAASRLRNAAAMAKAVGRDVTYVDLPGWEALVGPYLEGATLSMQLETLSLAGRLRVLVRVAGALRRLHRRGVAHGDLRPDNVLMAEDGSVELIDFDRGSLASRRRASLIDFVGIGGRRGLSENPFWSLVIFTLAPKSRSFARRLRTVFRDSRGHLEAPLDDADLELLRSAWQRAQQSSANAPGQGLAYYALTYRRYHFPGERPWALRWEYIRGAVDFQGKCVLELGCNLALLSALARIHGATRVTAVDHDPGIIEAARVVSRAFGVDIDLREVDLASASDWEEPLRGADIVVAMSLLHWLPDKRRALNFLSEHQELIYEGHDSLEVECNRLMKLGFGEVRVLTRTERGRHLLHAVKG